MKKENMVDPFTHHDIHADITPFAESSMSEELKKAIQSLIYQMRELGPIQAA
jgi:hypothetical protein